MTPTHMYTPAVEGGGEGWGGVREKTVECCKTIQVNAIRITL